MNRALMTSASSMTALQQAIDTVANNISNADTTGFKERQAQFSSLLEQNFTDQPDATNQLNRDTPLGLREGNGSKVASTSMDMSNGAIKQTDRPLDVALTQPDEFFTIKATNSNGSAETQYTRDGSFNLSPSAANPNMMNLVTADGSFVLGQNGKPLEVPVNTSSVEIDSTGTLQATSSNGIKQSYGSLGIVSISRPQLLTSAGDSSYTLPNLASLNIPSANVLTRVSPQNVSLKTGALEQSNVDLTQGMTDLMQLQRSYQLNSNAVQITDQMMNLVNNINS